MPEHQKDHARSQPATPVHKAAQPEIAPVEDDSLLRQALIQPSSANLTASVMRMVQRQYGNQFAQHLVARAADHHLIQRDGVWKEGGTNATEVSPAAKARGTFIVGKGLHSAGALADGSKVGRYLFQSLDSFVAARGWRHNAGDGANTLVYESFKNQFFCGGRAYGNRAATSRLPIATTYTEWDVNALTINAGVIGGRDGERIIVGATGKKYYTNDHYANFTEFS